MWLKLVWWWLAIIVSFVVVSIVLTGAIELLIGPDERNIHRSGLWVQRIEVLRSQLRGACTLGMAWTFSVFVMVGLGLGDSTPTARERWGLVMAVASLFVAWVVSGIILAGTRARHSERIQMLTRGSGRRS